MELKDEEGASGRAEADASGEQESVWAAGPASDDGEKDEGDSEDGEPTSDGEEDEEDEAEEEEPDEEEEDQEADDGDGDVAEDIPLEPHAVLVLDGSAELEIWLLDHLGQRMGSQVSSDEGGDAGPTPYRLVLASGEVRTGFANDEGLVVEPDVHDTEPCLLQWGRMDDVEAGTLPPEDDEAAKDYYLY